MRINILKYILIFLLLSANVQANVFDHPSNIDKISRELPALNSVQCKFRQEKTISGMVLKSSGNFRFEKDKGVIFNTIYPIKTTTSYTSREFKQINNVINAISNKSYSRLQKEFNFYFESNGINWELGLIPKQKSAAYNYLKSIEIEGSKKQININRMVILTTDNIKTEIWFY